MIILDDNSNSPLYVQIYDQLKKEILSGQLPEGSTAYVNAKSCDSI